MPYAILSEINVVSNCLNNAGIRIACILQAIAVLVSCWYLCLERETMYFFTEKPTKEFHKNHRYGVDIFRRYRG